MSKVTVHWVEQDIKDCGDFYSVDAKFEEEGLGYQKAWICSKDEEHLLRLTRHFSKSIEPVEIHF